MSTTTAQRMRRQETTSHQTTLETPQLENPVLENTILENPVLDNTRLETPTTTVEKTNGSVHGRVIKGVKHSYTILEQLAGGSEGFATVSFKAESEGKLYVLKGKTVGLMQDPYDLWKTTKDVSEALTNLNQPGLVTDTEVLVNGPYVINVRPWIEGKTLDEIVSGKQFTPTETHEFGMSIAKQLGGAHSKNIIHRDIKPNNIIRSADGDHLIDFGVAKKIERAEDPDDNENLTNMTIVGTPAYRAPEIMFGRADARADIYSLGHTLLYTLTGKHPTKAGTEEQKYDYTTKTISKLNIDDALKETLCVMTNPDKTMRYKTMDEVIAALDPKAMEKTTQENIAKTATQGSDEKTTAETEQSPETYDAVKLLREKGSAGLEHRIGLLKKEFKERYAVQGPIPDAMDSALTKDLHVTLTELGYELQPFSDSTTTYNGVRKRKDGSGIDVIMIDTQTKRSSWNDAHRTYHFAKNEKQLRKIRNLTKHNRPTDDSAGQIVSDSATTLTTLAAFYATGALVSAVGLVAPYTVAIPVTVGIADGIYRGWNASKHTRPPEKNMVSHHLDYSAFAFSGRWVRAAMEYIVNKIAMPKTLVENAAIDAALTIDTPAQPKSKFSRGPIWPFYKGRSTESNRFDIKSIQSQRDDRYNGYFAKLERATERGNLKTVMDVVQNEDPRKTYRRGMWESTRRETATYTDPIESAKKRGDLTKKDLEATLSAKEQRDSAADTYIMADYFGRNREEEQNLAYLISGGNPPGMYSATSDAEAIHEYERAKRRTQPEHSEQYTRGDQGGDEAMRQIIAAEKRNHARRHSTNYPGPK